MIVVTGAAGFIGGHLVRHLRAAGHHVVGLDRRPGSDVLADLTALPSDPAVGDVLRDAEAVFHLAGAGGVRLDGPEAEATWWRCNVLATEAVLAAVPRATPLVVASSSSVYGGIGPGARPCRESDRLRPRGGYARSKVEVERRVAARRAAGGRALVVRPFTVAGEGQRPDMALARWIAAARAGEPLRVHGSAARRRDVTDVRQVVAALAALAAHDAHGTVNVGTGVAHTLCDLVRAVAEAVRPTGVVIEPTHRDDVDATLADTRRCRRLAGFVPITDLRSLVARQAAATEAVGAASGPGDQGVGPAGLAIGASAGA